MFRHRRFAAPGLCIVLILCACSPLSTEEYSRPDVEIPADYENRADSPPGPGISSTWWRGFGDRQLDQLIERSLTGNLDLAIAVARLEEADAAIAQVGASLLPRLSSNVNVSRQGVRNPFTNDLQSQNTYSADVQLGWEIDTWGKLRKGVKARQSAYQASEADWRAARLTTVSQVASTYFLIRQFDEQLDIQAGAVDTAEQILGIYRAQYAEGVTANTQVLRQQAEVNNLRRTKLDLERERQLAENALAALLGVTPAGFSLPSAALSAAVKPLDIPAGLPAQLLSRRPDVLAAEYRILEAYDLLGQAQLARLPSISLTGNANSSGNLASDTLTNLVRTATYGVGPSINIPIFDASIGARVRSQRASARTLEVRYQKTVLLAFTEVENALINLGSRQLQRTELRAEVDQLQRVARQINAQLEAGMVSQLDVLESQRRLLGANQLMLQNQRQLLSDTVTLYKAMGGGWDEQTLANTTRS